MIYLYAIIQVLLFPLAILYSHCMEWALHRYLLHGIGKNKESIWSFHWSRHHKNARKNNFYDKDYEEDWTGAPLKEKISLCLLLLLHLPLIIVAPLFFAGLVVGAYKYYTTHKYAHLHPIWGKVFLTWHYDHHMGKNQDANWGVTTDWVDNLMKTRILNYEHNKKKTNRDY